MATKRSNECLHFIYSLSRPVNIHEAVSHACIAFADAQLCFSGVYDEASSSDELEDSWLDDPFASPYFLLPLDQWFHVVTTKDRTCVLQKKVCT